MLSVRPDLGCEQNIVCASCLQVSLQQPCSVHYLWQRRDLYHLIPIQLKLPSVTLRYVMHGSSLQYMGFEIPLLIYVVCSQGYVRFSRSWSPSVACQSNSVRWAEWIQHRGFNFHVQFGESDFGYMLAGGNIVTGLRCCHHIPKNLIFRNRQRAHVFTKKRKYRPCYLVAQAELAGNLEKSKFVIVRVTKTRLSLTLACCSVAPSWFLFTCALKFVVLPEYLTVAMQILQTSLLLSISFIPSSFRKPKYCHTALKVAGAGWMLR